MIDYDDDESIDRDPRWHEIQLKVKADKDFRAEIGMVLQFHGKDMADLEALVVRHKMLDELNAEECDYEGPYCVDCGVDTVKINEYYNVKDRVWELTGLGPDDGMLCIGCLEDRIGRKLQPEDFGYCLINWDRLYLRSARFHDRLGWGPYAE